MVTVMEQDKNTDEIKNRIATIIKGKLFYFIKNSITSAK